MKKKLISLILVGIMTFAGCFALGGCAPDEGVVEDKNVLNVRIYKGGHGTTYIEELAKAFNSAYADKGYSVNLLQPSTTLSGAAVYRDIYSNSGVDVYFAGSLTATEGSGNGGASEYGQTFADITDLVVNKTALTLNGEEESVTVGEKLINREYENMQHDGKWYGIPYVNGAGGLAVNVEVLKRYAPDMYNEKGLPVTTDDLFEYAHYMLDPANDKNLLNLSTRPFTYAEAGNNYANVAMTMWLAQYIGEEDYNTFFSFQKKDGTKLEKSEFANQFKGDGMLHMLENFVELYDNKMQTSGVRTQTFDEAQNIFMNGKAAFYFVGDWMFNEEFNRNEAKLNDITFTNIPLTSALGQSLFGEGTSANITDAEKCDDVLREIALGADAGKEVSVIEKEVEEKYNVSLETKDVQTVCERRGYFGDRSSSMMVISEKSSKKDLAALFLRFCAGNEAGAITAINTHTASPYAPNALAESEYEWIKKTNDMINHKYNKPLISSSTGYRKSIGIAYMIPLFGEIPVTYITAESRICSVFDDNYNIVNDGSIYKEKAAAYQKEIISHAQEQVDKGKW